MVDRKSIANLIREAARRLVIPRFRALGSGDIREKKPGDPVTIADIEMERELTRLLTAFVAGARVVGEESVGAEPHLGHGSGHRLPEPPKHRGSAAPAAHSRTGQARSSSGDEGPQPDAEERPPASDPPSSGEERSPSQGRTE